MILGLFRSSPVVPIIPAGRRVYAVGDIHGRLDLFENMLELLRDDNAARGPAQTDVILLGDLIDRGPSSAEVVRLAMKPLQWAHLIVLKGNHEASLLDTVDGVRDTARMWLENGGRAALRSWGAPEEIVEQGGVDDVVEAARANIPREELAWLARARQCVQIGDYYFVHAGVRPGVDLSRQTLRDSLWIRSEFLGSKRDHGAVVVHGHSISRGVEERDNRIGIDTGAYATDRLTALGLEGASRWFVQTGPADRPS